MFNQLIMMCLILTLQKTKIRLVAILIVKHVNMVRILLYTAAKIKFSNLLVSTVQGIVEIVILLVV